MTYWIPLSRMESCFILCACRHREAYEILKHTEEIEACGILCRIPNWWRKKYASVSVTMKMGEKKPSLLGFDSLLSIQPEFSVDGVALTKEDIEQLLLQSEGLAFLKGKWVEVNHKKLQALLKQMENSENESITLMEALRTNLKEEEQAEDDDKRYAMWNGSSLFSKVFASLLNIRAIMCLRHFRQCFALIKRQATAGCGRRSRFISEPVLRMTWGLVKRFRY
ncbi:MAG: SNF2 helicase-associated domain-containing protein [[Clostridium] innocuum]